MNQGIIGEWQIRGNFDLRILCKKLSETNYLQISLESSFVAGLQMISLYFVLDSEIIKKIFQLAKYEYFKQPVTKFNKYISCAAKGLRKKLFDAGKQHSRAQANILKLFVLIKNEIF